MEIVQHEKNVLENMIYLSVGYGLCALENMIPADVPIVFLGEIIDEKGINFLKEIEEKACLICKGETAEFFLKNNINVDFIFLQEECDYLILQQGKMWVDIPLITTTGVSHDVLKKHHGKKFFYFSGSEIENYLFNKTVKNSKKQMYWYNTLVLVHDKGEKSIFEFLASYMGASYTIFLGFDEDTENELVIYKKQECVKIVETSSHEIYDYFKVSVSMGRILEWILPIYESKDIFLKAYTNLFDEITQINKTVHSCIALYENLYQMAQQKNVWKNDLDQIITELNQNTQNLENIEYISYLLDISEKIIIKEDKRTKNNEIAEVALDAIQKYKKLESLLEAIEIKNVEEIKNNYMDSQKTRNYEGIENILLVGGSSQYNVLPYFVEGLKTGFQKAGITTYIYISSDLERLEQIIRDGYNYFQNTTGYQYILLMNGVFLEIERYDVIVENYRNLFDNEGSKIIPMFVDHPCYHKGRLSYAHYTHMVLFADGNWVKYVKNNLKNVPDPVFLPLGGIEYENKLMEFYERENKVVFFGGYSDLKEIQRKIEEHKYLPIIRKIIERLMANPKMTIENIVDSLEEENNSKYTIHHVVFDTDVFGIIDEYIRHYYRQKVIFTIAKKGIPIDIYGWNNVNYSNYPNVQLKEAVPLDKMLEICQNTRFVLNVQPWIKVGTQERVFNTMLCGAIAITDETQYLIENTVDKQNILMYKLQDIEELPCKIQYYMNNEIEAQKIAEAGYMLAKQNHTWSNREEELVKIMKAREI